MSSSGGGAAPVPIWRSGQNFHPCRTAMPLPTLRSDIPTYTASGVTSAAPPPPGTSSQRLSAKPTLTGASSSWDGISTGRIPARSDRSATRAERFADFTDENVATARTSVPPAVASDEMVTQSAIAGRV
jgi:hypothetical protein